jgi:hypothetical protein
MAQTLVKKLLIKPGYKTVVIHAPEGFRQELGDLPEGATLGEKLDGKFDHIHFFAKTKADVEQNIDSLKSALKDGGLLWISYPKGKALKTDLNRDLLYAAVQAHGLEGVALISIDDTWSAMRFKIV